MLFAIDIDGTIATHTEQRLSYLPYFNRTLGLGLSKEQLAAFPRFFTFQERVIFPWMNTQERKILYKEASKQLQYDPDCQQAAIPIAGAVEGTQRLAEYGRVIYVTYRKPDTEQITRRWLANNGFPSPEGAYCSEYSYDKIKYAQQEAEEEEQVIMVDNDIKGVMIGFRAFCTNYREQGKTLLNRIGFILYGDQVLDPVQYPKIAPVMRLPLKRLVDWQDTPSFLQGDFHGLVQQLAQRQSRAAV